tara:strand:- start:350 stop:571 length:222 start_codon:yes stop_codon:yes gene_type:complete
MDDLLDMIIADESPSQISDTIKDMLFAKSAERVEAARSVVSNGVFGEDDVQVEVENEDELSVNDSVDTEEDTE